MKRSDPVSYFTCAICQRVSALAPFEVKCPCCGSLSGEYSSEPPSSPKGVIRPSRESTIVKGAEVAKGK